MDTFGTGRVPEQRVEAAVRDRFGLTPAAIIASLARPIYRSTTTYGHFGHQQFPWEQTNQADAIGQAIE